MIAPTGLYKFIHENSDEQILHKARKYIKDYGKVAANKQHLTFNHRAKRYDLVPRSLNVFSIVIMLKGQKLLNNPVEIFY